MTVSEKITFLLEKEWECYAITFCGRSGSYFLHTVFDGHKSILSLPPWCSGIYKKFISGKRPAIEKMHIKSVEDIFGDIILHLSSLDEYGNLWIIEGSGASGPHDMFGANKEKKYEYDINILKKNISDVLSVAAANGRYVSRKNVFLAFYIAYGMTIGITLDEMMSKSVLLFQMHTLHIESLSLLRKDFPKLKHIIAAKNPVKSLFSHLQHYRTRESSIDTCIWSIGNSFESGIIQPFMNDKNTIAIKIELINTYKGDYMKAVLSHLGLEWDGACAESTVNGEIFWWKTVVSSGTTLSTGFNDNDNEDICRIKKVSCEDKILLSYIFKDRCDAWKYKICPAEKISKIGRVLYREFDFLKAVGFDGTYSRILSQEIWDLYLALRENEVAYPTVIPFDYAQNELECIK